MLHVSRQGLLRRRPRNKAKLLSHRTKPTYGLRMKKTAVLIGLLGAILVSGLTVAGTQRTRPFVTNYAVNVASIAALPGMSGIDPRRIISSAGSYWSAYGGAARAFEDIGVTSATFCSFGYGVIHGDTGQSVVGPSAAAQADTCFGGFRLVLFSTSGTRQWFTQPTTIDGNSICAVGTSGQCVELSWVMRHEFGHYVLSGTGEAGGGHISTPLYKDECLMNEGGAANGLCEREIDIVGAISPPLQNGLLGPGFIGLADGGIASSSRATSYGWPTPSGWNSPSATSAPIGIGGFVPITGRNAFGYQIDRVAYARTDASPHVIETCSVSNCAGTRISVGVRSVRRPAVAYDPTRRIWYMFAVETSQTDSSIANKIRVLWSSDGSSWSSLGFIPDTSTQHPVSASYDAFSDSFVVAWTNSDLDKAWKFVSFDPGLTPGTGGTLPRCNRQTNSGAPYALGCYGEVIVSVVSSGGLLALRSHIRLANADPERWGFIGLGAPAIACDPGGSYYQCEVFTMEHSPAVNMISRRLCIGSSGTSCGSTGQYNYGISGTDYPIFLSQRRPNGSGVFLMSVRGTDDKLYWRSKTSIQDAFGPWQTVSSSLMVSAPAISLPSDSGSYESMMSYW
jgi:hypothetical protein